MPDLALHNVLERVTALYRAELRRAAGEHDLKLAQLEALHYFARSNRYSDSPARLKEFLGTTKGTISQTVGVLESKGLIEKTVDESDKRVVHCSLTPAGRKIVAATLPVPILAETSTITGRRLSEALTIWLTELQRKSGQRTFGTCKTCAYFETARGGRNKYRCGLTQEPLSTADSERICHEHRAR